MSIVGYHAIVTMHAAAWGDESGSVVTFRLPTQENTRNPFHAYTKRRSGRSGTRFHMVCNQVEGQAIYDDEVMLAGWNDSQQNGHTVKFWIAADQMGHPFEGIGRKTELALALAELDDDNEAIDPNMRDKVERQTTHPSERLSYAAVMLCKNSDFWEFINGETEQSGDFLTKGVTDEAGAKQWIYQKCGILSRAELDNGGQASVLFDHIRKSFANYMGSMC